jgi:hypothetical protein
MSTLAPLSDLEIAAQEDAYVTWLAEQRGCSLEEARAAARKRPPVRYETIRRYEPVAWPDNVVCLDSRRAS